MTPADLPPTWRERAELLARHGATEAAASCRHLADELESALRSAENELLTPDEARARFGVSPRTLRGLVQAGRLENQGRKHAPRYRASDLADLPCRARRQIASEYNPTDDAAALLARFRGGAA